MQMNSSSLWKGCPWTISSTHLPLCTCGQWIQTSSIAMSNWNPAWNNYSLRHRKLFISSLASVRGVINSHLSACQGKGKKAKWGGYNQPILLGYILEFDIYWDNISKIKLIMASHKRDKIWRKFKRIRNYCAGILL